jgi:hypothetical protein
LEFALTLALGVPFLGHFGAQRTSDFRRVLYVQAENSTARVRRDLDEIICARGLGAMIEVNRSEYEPLADDEDDEVVGHRLELAWSLADWSPHLDILSHPGMDLAGSEDDLHWLEQRALGDDLDYLIIDPIYLLAHFDPLSTKETGAVLSRLSRLRDATKTPNRPEGTAVIFTHQMSNKNGNGDVDATKMLGSTLFQGWYEAAIFCSRDANAFFRFKADNLREMGEEREFGLLGLGVGQFYYEVSAQDATDSSGRKAPRVTQKKTNLGRLRELVQAHPHWSTQNFADEIGVSKESIKRYLRELRDTEPKTSDPPTSNVVELFPNDEETSDPDE